jgi:hypothetical protein
MKALGKTYTEIQAAAKIVALPQIAAKPRILTFEDVRETNGRFRPFLDARLQVGALWWKRQVDVMIWKK